ncbi:class I SAM-dependent methyltransferase [Gammaproteobacteria bacterium]|jgi:trans-aconitate methyltransferase|nr:class I SAM-dependent methyltransferase [Gammaproteobacteria bacterium]MDA9762619.1 class I SAM-dependent methyltransferase [Gammaproteobacteria bacterium]MDA9834341.1 class I SAM-dependent methyltransferase [Gammaproteobacteria bacterium]MDA9869548.1 class I SAM-dependent methyltransferase [Gammaproteobacteria bacterium]MDA9979637.1 class I SAM-dependent methyltransferase [Gammaproteobacteria bacterium]
MRIATEVFSEWAEKGKDIGMEKGHASAVEDMINFAIQDRINLERNFSFLDLGCGNGWVVRRVETDPLCVRAVGIDGAKQMIEKATQGDSKSEYLHENIDTYSSPDKFDLIHSMEVLYYLEDPALTIKKIADSWLNKEGRLIAGVDLYFENTESHSWEEKVGTKMMMLKEAEWIEIFSSAGLKEVKSWRSNQNQDWAGTLVLTGKK